MTGDRVPAVAGIYNGISDEDYHGDLSSLSSSAARALLTMPPARWKWERDHGQKPSKAFDLGHGVHSLALGSGPGIVVPTDPASGLPYETWQTKDSKAQVAAARAAGVVPLKLAEAEQAEAMANALRAHPLVGRLLADGQPELSLWWEDPATGVRLRARPDWLRYLSGEPVMVDVKSTEDASPAAVRKTVEAYGYHMQDPFYSEGLVALTGEAPDFLFAFVEKKPPYLVAVYRVSDDDRALGHSRNRRAIELYAKCADSDDWPGYPPEIQEVTLPPWAAA